MRIVCFIMFFVTIFTMPSAHSENEYADLIETAVKEFMRKTDGISDFKKEVSIFYKNPNYSVSCLIKELHPVNDKVIFSTANETKVNSDTLHIIWCIRALRHLTNLNFYSMSKESIDDELRRGHLYVDDESKMPFFMTKMSTETIFIAPVDAQKSIIDQWKNWYEKYGNNYDYENNRQNDITKYVR